MESSLVLPSLEATPGLLRSLTGDCPPERAWAEPGPGEWSMGEVLCHLVAGDQDTFLPRLRRMVAEERPVFGRRDPGPGAAPERELPALLAAFETARAEAVKILRSLDDAGWRRQGVSPSRGPVTVAAYASTMAEHDREHLRQLQDVRQALGLLPKRAEAHVALPLAEVVTAIRGTPDQIRALAAGLGPDRLRHRPRQGQWSMKEVMAHLLKVERDLFLPRLRRMLAEDRPAFERFDPDAWAAEEDHGEGDFGADWESFARARRETVGFLESLSEGAAQRLGLSSFFGPITLGAYATHVAEHDLEHLRQLAACREAVMEAH